MTVLTDLDGSRVLDVGPERTQAAADSVLATLTVEQRQKATTEGFNSVIQALKYAARGFRSFGNYRTRILFFCGKLDLRPQLPCH